MHYVYVSLDSYRKRSWKSCTSFIICRTWVMGMAKIGNDLNTIFQRKWRKTKKSWSHYTWNPFNHCNARRVFHNHLKYKRTHTRIYMRKSFCLPIDWASGIGMPDCSMKKKTKYFYRLMRIITVGTIAFKHQDENSCLQSKTSYHYSLLFFFRCLA